MSSVAKGVSKAKVRGMLKRATKRTPMEVDARGRPTAMFTPISRGGFPGGPVPRNTSLPFYRQPELKVVDIAKRQDEINTTAVFALLNGTLQGAAVYNRIGNEIEMKSFHLIGQVIPNGNAGLANNPDYLRIMAIYDRQPNGLAPAIADLLLSYDSAGATTTNSLSHLNPNNFDRFKVLADIRIDIADGVQAGGLTQGVANVIDYKGEFNINRFINLRGMGTKYKASTGAVGDVTSGALFLVLFGNNAAGGNAEYSLQWTGRLRYVD